jgi:hypothetical protein
MVPINITFEGLSTKIQQKFAAKSPFKFKYKESDGEFVLMTDQEDMEIGFEMHGIEYGVRVLVSFLSYIFLNYLKRFRVVRLINLSYGASYNIFLLSENGKLCMIACIVIYI